MSRIIKYRWWLGFATLVVFVVVSVGYSLKQPTQYAGEVSFRIGRVPNVEAITKVAALTNVGKGVWRLFERGLGVVLGVVLCSGLDFSRCDSVI